MEQVPLYYVHHCWGEIACILQNFRDISLEYGQINACNQRIGVSQA
jgi:hypothetical protein